MGKVLITGASGLVGRRLTALLLEENKSVNVLGRNLHADIKDERVKPFIWDVEKEEIDPAAFEGVTSIIHLAGAGIAEKHWTEKRKKEIIDSRVKSAGLIARFLKNEMHTVKTFVSATAVGYYGDCADEILKEDHKPGKDFLAEVCKKWEAATIKIGELSVREVRCRFGIVLSKEGGALPELTKTMAVGVAGYFDKENLYYPWIHIDDVCGILMHAIKNEKVTGVYNTTAPTPLLMKDLMEAIVKAKKSHALVLAVPPFTIKLAMGEMSEMLLQSARCNAEKIMNAGYKFEYSDIDSALKEIYDIR